MMWCYRLQRLLFFSFCEQEDPLKMYLNDIATIPANMAGLPALSVPCGFSHDLPVGLQLVGKACDEETLIRMGYTYQQHTAFHQQSPEAFAR